MGRSWIRLKYCRQLTECRQNSNPKREVSVAKPRRRNGPKEKCVTNSITWFSLTRPYQKMLDEVPTYKLITPSVVSERLKVRGSLARKGLEELHAKGLIRQVV